jgi:pyruvate/2-oxoglutarate dehydrogenase complex dihydrolipoamide dehydrogenase (E3) component
MARDAAGRDRQADGGAGALTPDLCVIGAGSGGLSVAAGAAQLGASVVLVEAGEMGGDCLNVGCVPSKSLIAAAKRAHGMAGGLGVAAAPAEVDFGAVMAHVRGVIAAIAPHDSQARFEGLGVRVIRARARFTARDAAEAGGVMIRPRRFVIATGSRPAIPAIPGLDATPFLTNETIWGLDALPRRLVALGGGAIGVELAQAFRRLGAEVTLVEAARLMGREDTQAVDVVRAALLAEGVALREGVAVAAAAPAGDGVALTLADGARVEGTHLLVAAGRRPALEGLGLDAAGVATGPRGVSVDAGLRSTTNRRVYAIGDVAGGGFTHEAGFHAGLVIRSALFRLPARTGAAIPRVTFADPELAQIGMTEAEARAAFGAQVGIARADFADNDRARADGATAGFVKAVIGPRGRILGATVVGAQAGDLIQTWALAMGAGLRIGAVAGMIAPYPTRGEAAKRAASAHFAPRLFGNPMVRRIVRLLAKLG